MSQRLKELRNKAGLSQSALCRDIGLNTNQYQRYEYGHNAPRMDHAVSLADFYGTSVDYLIGRSDDPERR